MGASAWHVFCGCCIFSVLHGFLSLSATVKTSRHLIATLAEKEATVYIVDVGKSMGERRQGRSVTDLEWAMRYVWDRISATVYTSCSDGELLVTDGHLGGYWEENSYSWSSWS